MAKGESSLNVVTVVVIALLFLFLFSAVAWFVVDSLGILASLGVVNVLVTSSIILILFVSLGFLALFNFMWKI